MQHLPGQDIPPGGRWRGCVRGREGVLKGGTPAGGGRRRRPAVALPPASVRRGQEGAAHTAVPTPAPDQAVPVNPASASWATWHGQRCPPASYPHATRPTPVLRHQIAFYKSSGFNAAPPKTILWALQPPKYTTKQDVTLKPRCIVYISSLLLGHCLLYFIHVYQDKKNLVYQIILLLLYS